MQEYKKYQFGVNCKFSIFCMTNIYTGIHKYVVYTKVSA